MPQIDHASSTFGLHHSLVIPIGAKSRASIERYVGNIEKVFGNEDAFLVTFEPHGLPNELPVWKMERSALFHQGRQLWVHVNSRKYRRLYQELFREMMTGEDQVIDHIMNRKLARALQYNYVRLLHVSRAANSSSGRGGETVAMGFLPVTVSVNPEANASEIVYADPMDLLKMLDVKVGGFGLEVVADNHYLFYG